MMKKIKPKEKARGGVKRNGQATLREETSPAIPGLNVKLLRKVQKHILEEPRRLNMHRFVQINAAAPCGTAACIAGWTAILGGNRTAEELWNQGGANRQASKLLNIERGYGYEIRTEAAKLFYVENWPTSFRHDYQQALTPNEQAEITANRIDYFIKEGK